MNKSFSAILNKLTFVIEIKYIYLEEKINMQPFYYEKLLQL